MPIQCFHEPADAQGDAPAASPLCPPPRAATGGIRARREYPFGAVQVWRPLCAGRRHLRLGQGEP